MGVTPISDFLSRDLKKRHERAYLAGCLVLSLFYTTALVSFSLFDTPVDKTFYAERNAAQIRIVGSHPVTIGNAMDVITGASVTKQIALLKGWGVPESWGVWSDGKVASFAIQLPAYREGRLQLDLACAIMLDSRGVQTVAAEVNHTLVGTWYFRRSTGTFSIPLPGAAITRSGLVLVTFRIGHPVTPGRNGDLRSLGIGLRSLVAVRG